MALGQEQGPYQKRQVDLCVRGTLRLALLMPASLALLHSVHCHSLGASRAAPALDPWPSISTPTLVTTLASRPRWLTKGWPLAVAG